VRIRIRIWITSSHTYLGPKDSLAATSLGFCVGTNQQWVYAYTDSPPNAFTTVDDAVRSCEWNRSYSKQETTRRSRVPLTSGRPAPARLLTRSEHGSIAEIPHEAVLAGTKREYRVTRIEQNTSLWEVLSNVQSTVPDHLWETICTIESDHPDLIQKMTAATTVVAATKPELVEIRNDTPETLRAEDPRRTAALESLKTLSEHQPRILIDALPTIETILKDGRTSTSGLRSMLFFACEGRTRTR